MQKLGVEIAALRRAVQRATTRANKVDNSAIFRAKSCVETPLLDPSSRSTMMVVDNRAKAALVVIPVGPANAEQEGTNEVCIAGATKWN